MSVPRERPSRRGPQSRALRLARSSVLAALTGCGGLLANDAEDALSSDTQDDDASTDRGADASARDAGRGPRDGGAADARADGGAKDAAVPDAPTTDASLPEASTDGGRPATYDAARDFSSSSNPSGAWTYGWWPAGGGAFSPLTLPVADAYGVSGWQAPNLANAYHNGTASTIVHPTEVTLAPARMVMHPGENGEKCVVRWKAEAPGDYQLHVTFEGVTNAPERTTTDVAVFRNGALLWSDELNAGAAPSNARSYAVPLEDVATGDRIDFAVGFGSNGNYAYDATGFDAVITRP